MGESRAVMKQKSMIITSWGRNRDAEMTALRPERLSAVTAALRQPGVGTGTIAYGDGRNYGDLAMRQNGRVVLTRRLNRILSFEKDTGLVSVEPGVTFRELHSFASERGYLVPVVPGTAFVTLGGGVASDIHGKNQDTQGCFGDHIEWLDLVVASGDVIRVSRSEHPELFSATIGGCGLTGVISAIGLRLRQLKANAVSVEEWRVKDLDSFFDLMHQHRTSSTYTVGWVDALQKGRSLGRGIFQAAEPVFSDGFSPRTSNRKIPFTCPDATLNRASVQAFNSIYYRRVPKNGRSRLVGYEAFHHPLDAISDWNRLYGKSGFFQFQCVLPDESAAIGIRRLLERISGAQAASFLAVLKTFGKEGLGDLSFPRPGVTLSLDIPARGGGRKFVESLDALTLDHGGRVYLAKDATLTAERFALMYPKLDKFRETLSRYDPDCVFVSDLARRLKVRPSPS